MYKAQWEEFLNGKETCLIFDTETTGLSVANNDVLSLSWQIVNLHSWVKLCEGNVYFDWVSDERVSPTAIRINGLTKEHLAELGTISRKEGMKMFIEALRDVDIVVAHNAFFDKRFVDATIEREGLPHITWPIIFDTKNSTIEYCRIPKKGGGYKEPKLEELAHILDIDDTDIDHHQSCSDAELTKRCFRKLVEGGFVLPTVTGIHKEQKENRTSKFDADHFKSVSVDDLDIEDDFLCDYDFVGKKCIVSGMSPYRDKLKQLLPEIGAILTKGKLSGATNALIVGEDVGPDKKRLALEQKGKRPNSFHIFSQEAVAYKLGLIDKTLPYMDNEYKLKISTTIGGISLFVSCYGIGIYDQSTHDSSTNYQDKLPMETILTTSLVTGIVLSIITWLLLTIYDCHKKAKEDDSVTTLELFKKEVFCKRTFIGLFVLIVTSFLVVFLGLALLALAVFLIPLLKGKFK